jgi:predicted enzyme related to lactoylglutathione lyase
MGNAVTQFQIVSTAPDETAGFYSALFAWRIDANNPMGYRRVDTGSSDGIQGGIWPAPPQAPTFVQLFVTVPDLKTAVAMAVELGAKVVIPPTMLPEGEEMAILHDPQGMPFGLWRTGAL